MSQTFDESWEKIGIAAALAHSYASDQGTFLPLLTGLLEEAMPEMVEIERKPLRLFSSDKRIALVRVHLGDDTFMIQQDRIDGPLVGWHVKVVRGITLKTEQIALQKWLEQVGQAIMERARESEEAALALKNFLEVKNL